MTGCIEDVVRKHYLAIEIGLIVVAVGLRHK